MTLRLSKTSQETGCVRCGRTMQPDLPFCGYCGRVSNNFDFSRRLKLFIKSADGKSNGESCVSRPRIVSGGRRPRIQAGRTVRIAAVSTICVTWVLICGAIVRGWILETKGHKDRLRPPVQKAYHSDPHKSGDRSLEVMPRSDEGASWSRGLD